MYAGAGARTETLRAYRAAAQMTMQENADILDGWTWIAACDRRTCPSCFAMHGSVQRLSEPMKAHVNCRCTCAPRVKGTAQRIASGAERFAALGAEAQRGVLGPAAYEAYRDGALQLEEMVGRRRSDRWGDSVHVRSLRSVIGEERAGQYVEIVHRAAQYEDWREADTKWWKTAYGLRNATDADWPEMVDAVAVRGFDPKPIEFGKNAGKTIGEVHYQKHVVKRGEWPAGTSIDEYYASGQYVARNASYVFVGKFDGHWRVTFLAPGGEMQGVGGYPFVMVEYRLENRHWSTVFQPKDGARGVDAIAGHASRSEVRWLRR